MDSPGWLLGKWETLKESGGHAIRERDKLASEGKRT